MSTRAVIQMKKTTRYEGENPNNGEHIIQYYHHYDGYTSYLGIELIKILLEFIKTQDPEKVKDIHDVEYFMDETLNQTYQRETPADIHGDIEYFYFIDFDDGIVLTRYKRNDWEKDKPENPRKWTDGYILFKAMLRDKYYKLEAIDYQDKIN
jgi:hypothetical protein